MVMLTRSLRTAILRHPRAVRALLGCGMVAPLLQATGDVLGMLRYPGYSMVGQSISDLTAAGAPTRTLVGAIDLVADGLLILFGFTVWELAGKNRALRISSGLVIANAAISEVVTILFPIHSDEPMSSLPNLLNIIPMATGMFCFVLAIGFGAVAFRHWFRYLSGGILLAYLNLTILGLLPRSGSTAAGSRGPTVGAQERTMMYSYLLWLALLAVALGREQLSAHRTGTSLHIRCLALVVTYRSHRPDDVATASPRTYRWLSSHETMSRSPSGNAPPRTLWPSSSGCSATIRRSALERTRRTRHRSNLDQQRQRRRQHDARRRACLDHDRPRDFERGLLAARR